MDHWNKLQSFLRDEDGLGTVEWVALTGAVVIGVIALGWVVMGGLKAPATSIGSSLTACTSEGCK